MSDIKDILPFYGKLSGADRLQIENLIPRNFSKGETIPKCLGVMCVLEGRLRIFIINDEGKEITLYRLFSDDVCVLSASCMMKNISFDVDVVAEEDTRVLTLPLDIYRKLESRYPEVASFTKEMMAARLSDVMWTLEQVVFKSMDKRVADYLMEQRAISQSDVIEITHETMAKDLGTAREVISRMLKYFQNEKYITQSRGRVEIINPKALMALSD